MITIEMTNSQCSARVTAQVLHNAVSQIKDCNPDAKATLLGTCPFIRTITIDIDTDQFKGVKVAFYGTPREADIELQSHTIASALAELMLCHCA